MKNENINILNKNESEKQVRCIKEIMNLNDYELNNLSYKEAIEKDKRNYCQYFISLLKTNHLFFFSFIRKNDYNSKIIKIFLFMFYFILSYAINGFFFSESVLHQIYKDKGNFNFIYQLYSSLISNAVNFLIKAISLSEKNILKIKQEKNIYNSEKKSKEIKIISSIKFKLFFFISFLFSLLFGYYISSFCAVYKNTQLYLIKDTMISFVLSLIYPLFIYLIPGVLRIYSLRDNSQKRGIIYNISKAIHIF